jgi:hypothetical protein
MGFYFDHCDEKYKEIDHDRVLSCTERKALERREELIWSILDELRQPANPIVRLYATLLVRALASSDEVLARRMSERVARITKKATALDTKLQPKNAA